jgi:L-lactate dehydrogenase complex protein LldG
MTLRTSLRHALTPNGMLSPVRMSSVCSSARQDLLLQFEAAAISVAASVERVSYSAGALAEAVRRIAAGSIAVAETLDLSTELFSELRKEPGVISGRSKRELAACDLGVTEAFAGVARTGSVCVAVDHDYSGVISLLSRVHVAVVSSETITERPGDLFNPRFLDGKALRRNVVFITGPSATADMGPLVHGVHGPHQLHIIVLE